MLPSLFGVNLPQTTQASLLDKINNLQPNQKKTLYFLYSEFLLRAKRNPSYREVLNRSNFSAIDGKGLHWAMWNTIYYQNKKPINLPFFGEKLFLFYILSKNFVIGVFTFLLIKNFNFSERTKNEVILGRNFVYDLLDIANQKKWSVCIIGGFNEKTEILKNTLLKQFPNIQLNLCMQPSSSDLMRDLPNLNQNNNQDKFNHTLLNTDNLLHSFLALVDIKKQIKILNPDLILTCLGGGSGKQEFFIDNLKSDKDINFSLAVGLGAALDHLGAGRKQKESPLWMQKLGLEWLYRFVNQPYRRSRIADSILSLFYFTSQEELDLRLGRK